MATNGSLEDHDREVTRTAVEVKMEKAKEKAKVKANTGDPKAGVKENRITILTQIANPPYSTRNVSIAI